MKKVLNLIEEKPTPQGIGMAVAFDWGLTVQILVTPFLPFFLGNSVSLRQIGSNSRSTTLLSILVSWPIAIGFAVFGEGVRRGWKWTRPIQIVANALGFLGGFAILVNLWNQGKQGNYWSLVTAVILLVFSPLIAWRMSRQTTARWFSTVKSSEARKRHGGLWIVGILLWSIVGGTLQAIAAMIR